MEDSESPTDPQEDQTGDSGKSDGKASCIAGLVIVLTPFLMFAFTPAEGALGWTGVTIFPIAIIVGGIIGISGIVSMSKNQSKTDEGK